MAFDAQMQWLIFEGSLPIFGAGLLYSAWGLVVAVARGSWTPGFAWHAAIDPLGWLYGALIISTQSAVRSFAARPERLLLAWGCMIGAGFCLLLLLAAMNQRGQSLAWQPRFPLKLSASILVIAVLTLGYFSSVK